MVRKQIKAHPRLIIAISLPIIVISLIVSAITFKSLLNKKSISTELKKDKVLAHKSGLSYIEATAPAQPEPAPAVAGTATQAEKAPPPTATNKILNSRVYLGFALEPVNFSRVSQVEGQIGRKFEILMAYKQWGNSANSTLSSSFFSVFNSTGKTPLISWEPWNPALGVNQANFKLSNIVAGNFDSYIKNFADQLKNFGKPVFLRFAHEMNGNWYPWGGTVNGNSAADYINAYRHVHNLVSAQGANNVTWVWCPDTRSYPNINGNDLADFYPGNSFVDWVGLDGYNWGSSRAGKRWESFSQVFSGGYGKVTKLTNKPIMIAETASTEQGGNKGAWISDTLAVQIPQRFPRIKALIWFNINKETNWDISSSSSAMSQFKNNLVNGIYDVQTVISASKIVSP